MSQDTTIENKEQASTILAEGSGKKTEQVAPTVSTESSASSFAPASNDKSSKEEVPPEPTATEPIDYSTKLTFPQGVKVDEPSLKAFSELAKGMNQGKGLSLEDAQKIVDLRGQIISDERQVMEKHLDVQRDELEKQYGDKLKTEVVPTALKAIDKYGDENLARLVKTNRAIGENPSIIAFLYKIGKNLTEDVSVFGKSVVDNSHDARLRRMFPSNFKT